MDMKHVTFHFFFRHFQVLFCSLTDEQRQLYKQFLRSDDVSFVLHEKREGGKYRARLLVALTALRKICNHPDLFLYSQAQTVNIFKLVSNSIQCY
jgi:SNF2 family DNA or RNA helicase